MRAHPFHPAHMGASPLAWYEGAGEARLAHDKSIVASHYPGLSYWQRESDGAMYLAGIITLGSECGVSTQIAVRVDFPPTYPRQEPRAFDTNSRFPHDADHHFYPNGQCCLWLPPESKWDTVDNDALQLFLDEVTIFFDRQLVYEATGEAVWPGGQRAHGARGYVEFVRDFLGGDQRLLSALSPTFANVSGIGRNSPCPCGSGIKYKRCHLTAVNQIRRRVGSLELHTTFRRIVRQTPS